ncbi:tudor and KH domain-containing protein isoform X1 [Danio rerio]|uniref:Tudor and KH domain-containing protein isoform X1 n=2 Tax=Danio rerio TaxID=7955 RepID=A0AC58GVF4_DANRE|nr:tudor and KH domain-containing protein isoform X1 [Danio rerio]|eukprot:XP_017213943.1 tudor and KH domain-containing protein isoform X1 [Danio rerio]
MDVAVPKSRVFLNYSPTALFSQWSLPVTPTQVMAAVQDGPWKSLSSGKKVALAAGISVGATVGYLIYRHIRNSTEQCQSKEESRISVPLDVYRSIARYQSAFLDIVNQKSGAQINVLPNTEEQNMVNFLIQGSPEQILIAQCALEKLATDCEVITDVIDVPQTAFGRIIGRGGETLKFINRVSGAKVNCSKDRGRTLEENGKITITGTRKEIQSAKEMIMEKVIENETVRKRISQASALRQRRKPPETQGPENELLKPNGKDLPTLVNELKQELPVTVNGYVDSTDTAENSLRSEDEEILSPVSPLEISKFEIPSPDLSFQPDEHLEVYVSASENPQHFWIQILGVRSLQLDKLTAEMSRFYNGDSSQEHRVETIIVGDIVAAPYRDHGTWNRARVLGIVGSGLVDLYYVDFGDNGELPREHLRSMRSDFLSLPFQAIECSLAGVRPEGEVWTEAALDDFERMTFCAEWKPLLAKLYSYSHSEISSWPSVKLYDNSQGKAVDLGKELIRLGHAVSCEDEGNGLRGDWDESRSLQKMLDDMTGATSELSMSCISLSGSPWVNDQLESSSRLSSSIELERADVDQNSTFKLMSSYSLIHSTPSQNLSDLVSQILETSSSMQDPPVQSNSLTPASPLHQLEISSSFSSPLNVETVTSALDSFTLNDEVFLGSHYYGRNEKTTSSASEETGSSYTLETHSENTESSNSSDGIRGVWYYLTSSRDSSEASLSTTMPHSSTTSSSYSTEACEESDASSGSVIELSSDSSRSVEDAKIALRTDNQTSDLEIITLSDGSSSGSEFVNISEEREHESETAGYLEESDPLKCDVRCQTSGFNEDVLCNKAESGRRGSGLKNMGLKSNTGENGDESTREVASISGSVDDTIDEEFN